MGATTPNLRLCTSTSRALLKRSLYSCGIMSPLPAIAPTLRSPSCALLFLSQSYFAVWYHHLPIHNRAFFSPPSSALRLFKCTTNEELVFPCRAFSCTNHLTPVISTPRLSSCSQPHIFDFHTALGNQDVWLHERDLLDKLICERILGAMLTWSIYPFWISATLLILFYTYL